MQTESIQSIIENINTRWDMAFNGKQAQEVAALYDARATIMPAGAAQVTGHEAILGLWENTIGLGITDHKIEMIEVGLEGSLAYQRGLWHAALVNAEGERQTFSGNLHVLYKLQNDGSWKALTHIWN